MQGESGPETPGRAVLTSEAGSPFPFTVVVAGAGPDSPSRAFTVTGREPATGSETTREYRLPDTQQGSYVAFFGQLARDFGTRVPRNRESSDQLDAETPLRPLLTENLHPGVLYGYGDPAVTRVPAQGGGEDAWYYLVVTSNDAPDAFPIARSRDLREWQPRGFVFPEGRKPRWAADGERVSDYWAPEMHRVGDGFLLCFAAREKDGGLAIGMAKAPGPDGPFVAADEPILRGGVIDPHILVDRDGSAFLFWKEDANDLWPGLLCELLHGRDGDGRLAAELFPCAEDRRTAAFVQTLWPWLRRLEPMERFCAQQVLIEAATADFSGFRRRLSALRDHGHVEAAARNAAGEVLRLLRTPVYAQRLSPDGLALVGERAVVLENDLEWEGHLVEGVWVRAHRGRHYMFYSGNDFSTARYGLGVAVADSPLGPYRKAEAPLLRSTARWLGPGHASVADGPDGEPRLFLHAFFPGQVGYKAFRALLTARIAFRPDGVVLA